MSTSISLSRHRAIGVGLLMSLVLALTAALPMTASAQRSPPPGLDSPEADRLRERQERFERGKERREKMMNRIRILKAAELGELLELDADGTARLTETLERFDADRRRLRLENFEYMRAIRQIAKGEAAGNAAELARRAAENRVRLAEIDQRELNAIVDGLPPEQAAKASLFLAQFPRKMERLADDIRRGRKYRGGENDGEGRRDRPYRRSRERGAERR